MPEQTHTSPQGDKYRLIAAKNTTPTTNTQAKPITVDSQEVEVIISDTRFFSFGSQWGHVVIVFGDRVYTRSHSKYLIKERGEYLKGNDFRDSVGLILRVSESEEQQMKTELERRIKEQKPYNLFTNSCSTNVADVLEMIGIEAHDPRYFDTPVSPKELLIIIGRSKRLKKKVMYAKAK